MQKKSQGIDHLFMCHLLLLSVIISLKEDKWWFSEQSCRKGHRSILFVSLKNGNKNFHSFSTRFPLNKILNTMFALGIHITVIRGCLSKVILECTCVCVCHLRTSSVGYIYFSLTLVILVTVLWLVVYPLEMLPSFTLS